MQNKHYIDAAQKAWRLSESKKKFLSKIRIERTERGENFLNSGIFNQYKMDGHDAKSGKGLTSGLKTFDDHILRLDNQKKSDEPSMNHVHTTGNKNGDTPQSIGTAKSVLFFSSTFYFALNLQVF
jgi:hypothetical protein